MLCWDGLNHLQQSENLPHLTSIPGFNDHHSATLPEHPDRFSQGQSALLVVQGQGENDQIKMPIREILAAISLSLSSFIKQLKPCRESERHDLTSHRWTAIRPGLAGYQSDR